MSAVEWICGLVGLLLMWLVVETLKSFFLAETLTRLERVPYSILRLARRRLRPEHRETVHDEEWLPELAMIVRESDGLPLTRLVRGVDFAVRLLFVAPTVSAVFCRFGRRTNPASGDADEASTAEATAAIALFNYMLTHELIEPSVGPTVPPSRRSGPDTTSRAWVTRSMHLRMAAARRAFEQGRHRAEPREARHFRDMRSRRDRLRKAAATCEIDRRPGTP